MARQSFRLRRVAGAGDATGVGSFVRGTTDIQGHVERPLLIKTPQFVQLVLLLSQTQLKHLHLTQVLLNITQLF